MASRGQKNTHELHDKTPMEVLSHNDEVSGESEAGSIVSNDADLEAVEASFVYAELNALTASAV